MQSRNHGAMQGVYSFLIHYLVLNHCIYLCIFIDIILICEDLLKISFSFYY